MIPGHPKNDATGLYYFNARYYDPQLGTFVSPDTLVSDPTNIVDYSRFAFGRLNPLRFSDPTGHQPQCDIATAACQQQMSAWSVYPPYADTISWPDFLTAYTQYNTYAADPGMLLQDFLIDAGDIPADQTAAANYQPAALTIGLLMSVVFWRSRVAGGSIAVWRPLQLQR